jgi:hypothetical protein
MSKTDIMRVTVKHGEPRTRGSTDWKRIDAMTIATGNTSNLGTPDSVRCAAGRHWRQLRSDPSSRSAVQLADPSDAQAPRAAARVEAEAKADFDDVLPDPSRLSRLRARGP